MIWQVALCVVAVAAALCALVGLWRDDRCWFDWDNYFGLRDQGLSHKAAVRELDRMWDERAA